MHPILIKFFGITIYTYGFMFALGLGLAIYLSLLTAKHENIDTDKMSDLIFWTVIIGIIGAKALLVITNPEMLKSSQAFIDILRSGGTFYGGIVFGLPFAVWYAYKKKLPLLKISDIIAPYIALGHSLGRLGCFSAGCCYGRATDSFLGVVFKNPIAHNNTGVPLNTRIYPTQLMESILNFLNFIVLLIFYKKKKYDGTVLILYVMNYAVIRFVLEFFRGDPDRGYVFGGISHPWSSLSIPQFISLIGFFGGLYLWLRIKKRAKQSD